MKRTTDLLSIGSKVKVQVKVIDSKLERDEIKYKLEVPKMWFTKDELETCDDDED